MANLQMNLHLPIPPNLFFPRVLQKNFIGNITQFFTSLSVSLQWSEVK